MTLKKPTANQLPWSVPDLWDTVHILIFFKEVTTVVFQANDANKNTLKSPNFTIRTKAVMYTATDSCCLSKNDTAWNKNITFHSLNLLHLIKSSCVILSWNFFHIVKVTFSKTLQRTTSNKVHDIQVEFEVPTATKTTIFRDVAPCSLIHSARNIPNYIASQPRRW